MDETTTRPLAQYHVFLSHNSRDKAIAREVHDALLARGVKCWLDEEVLRPGGDWQELLESGMRNSLSVTVLVGSHGIGKWQNEEARLALRMAVENRLPVIPVLLPGVDGPDSLPPLLANRTWVDFRRGLSEDGINQLLWGITGERLTLAPSANASGNTIQPKGDPDELVEIEVDVDESFMLRAFHGPQRLHPTIILRLAHRFLNHDRDRTVVTSITSSVWSAEASDSSGDTAGEIWHVRVPQRSLAIPPPETVRRITEEQLPNKWFGQFGPGDVPAKGLELQPRSVSDWFASEFHLILPSPREALGPDLWVRISWRSLGSHDAYRLFPVPHHALPNP